MTMAEQSRSRLASFIVEFFNWQLYSWVWCASLYRPTTGDAMRLTGTLLAAAPLIFAAPANAQWLSRTIEDPFGKDNIVGALTASEGKAFMIRCIGGKNLDIRFLPNERGSDDLEKFGNTVGVKILLRIDNSPVDELDATLHNGDNNKLVVDADIQLSLAERIAAAKTRIAVAIELMGQRAGSVSFTTKGSGPHIRKVIAACPAPLKPS